MRHTIILILTVFLFNINLPAQQQQPSPVAIVIHGGAGNISRNNIPPDLEIKYKAKLTEALKAGYDILHSGGTSTEAVLAAIEIMENSPLFNAGKGAVFTYEGKNELDASVMNGADLQAGAIAGVHTIKNPIKAAYQVMIQSPHVLLTGQGAEDFARQQGLEIVDPSYFYTQRRFDQLQEMQGEGKNLIEDIKQGKFGTVGCVALDKKGNLAAGTSTGGMSNKRFGRIGDSPIIGAGTYADNQTCAVSATGHGEFFMRLVIAYDITALMKYKKYSLEKACKEVIQQKLTRAGGSGGIIALDQKGNISLEFNSGGMFRGYIKNGQPAEVAIF